MKRLVCALVTIGLLMGMLLPAAASGEERHENLSDLLEDLYLNGTCLLADEVSYAYVSSMDEVLNDANSVAGMIYNLGIMTFDFEHDYERRRATLKNIQYYPGFRIAQAWTLDRTDLLTDQELVMLRQAEEMVLKARAGAQDPYQVLVRLHDLLIERVDYVEGSEDWGDVDTAIGALVNGRADCDGYADAFYLLCTLAGFPVRLQHGQAVDKNGEWTGHKWNAVYWDGKWHHVDVTWDDVNFPQAPTATSYAYFLVGSSMMNSHSWIREVSLCTQEEYTDWNLYYYTTDNSGLTCGAYYATIQDAVNYAVYMQRNSDRPSIHVMIDGNQTQKAQEINDLLAECGMTGRWYLWGQSVGDYTCLSITFMS